MIAGFFNLYTMSFTVYILHSVKLDKYYMGQTSNLEERIKFHNTGVFKNAYTSKAHDWVLVFFIPCTSKNQAIAIEKHIKRMKSHKYIMDLIKFPDISKRLIEQY